MWRLGALTVEGLKFAWVWDQERAGLSKPLYFQIIVKSTVEELEYLSSIIEGEIGGGLQEWQCCHS